MMCSHHSSRFTLLLGVVAAGAAGSGWACSTPGSGNTASVTSSIAAGSDLSIESAPFGAGHRGASQDPNIAAGRAAILVGRNTFRFDTFGDEAFWGDTLQLHRAIEGKGHGGVGDGVSPRTALAVGLKVDAQSLPPEVVEGVKFGKVRLDDPATTVALLKLNAVVGVTGFFVS